MSSLPPFALLRPATLEAAARLAAEPQARLVAGGTGLLPNLRRGLGAPRTLVSLEAIEGLRRIEAFEGGLRIGACVSLQRLAASREIPAALREAALSVGAPAHRAAATLGGNLCLDTRCLYYNQGEEWRRANGYCLKLGGDTCHVAPQGRRCRAAYSADLAPALLALRAQVEIARAGGREVRPLQDLFQDDGADFLRLAPGEIVAAVRLPAPRGRSGYAKLRARGAIDFPLAGVAMALELRAGRVAGLRIALTGTNSRPLLLAGTGALEGGEAGEALGAALAKLVQKQAAPMRTTVSAADYRRQGAAVLARRLLGRLCKEGGSS
jgi:4-hydroxybenzoyl-CoA reductase subunit beta